MNIYQNKGVKEMNSVLFYKMMASDSLIRRIIFAPIHFLEPKPYKRFIKKDMYEYFGKYGLSVERYYHTDYSRVLVLKKR